MISKPALRITISDIVYKTVISSDSLFRVLSYLLHTNCVSYPYESTIPTNFY